MVDYTCKSNVWEVGTRELEVEDHPWQHNKFEASLGYVMSELMNQAGKVCWVQVVENSSHCSERILVLFVWSDCIMCF